MFYVSAAVALSVKANMNIANIVCDLQCAFVPVYVCVCAACCDLCYFHLSMSSLTLAAQQQHEISRWLYTIPPFLLSHPPSLCIMFWLLEKVMRLGNFLCHSVISIFKYSPSFVYAARKLFEAFFFVQRYFEEALRLHPCGNLLDGLSRCAKSRCELRCCRCQGRPPFAAPSHPLN